MPISDSEERGFFLCEVTPLPFFLLNSVRLGVFSPFLHALLSSDLLSLSLCKTRIRRIGGMEWSERPMDETPYILSGYFQRGARWEVENKQLGVLV